MSSVRSRHLMLPSQSMGRSVHVWCFGHFGHPVVVFPSAAGFAHEWQAQGMVEALEPMLRAGRIKLYCPESNVAEAWTRSEGDPAWRIGRHLAYEHFVMNTLVPFVREDCHQPNGRMAVSGCSLGAMYAANFALKSSLARAGFEHLLAGFIDPGFSNSVLTLELKNARKMHPVPLWPGMRIGQVVWHRMTSSPNVSYRYSGRYNGDSKVTGCKGLL